MRCWSLETPLIHLDAARCRANQKSFYSVIAEFPRHVTDLSRVPLVMLWNCTRVIGAMGQPGNLGTKKRPCTHQTWQSSATLPQRVRVDVATFHVEACRMKIGRSQNTRSNYARVGTRRSIPATCSRSAAVPAPPAYMLGASLCNFSQFLEETISPDVDLVSAPITTPSCGCKKLCYSPESVSW